MAVSTQRRIQYGGVIGGQEEIDAVTEVLYGQGWGSGALVAEFEHEAARLQNRKHALFCNSGSSALLLAMSTLIKGSYVAMPALQFPTLYSAAVWCGLRPVLIDCDDSLNMGAFGLVHHSYVQAVAFVHVAGNPTNIFDVAEWCKRHGKILIEDNCEGFGGTCRIGLPEVFDWKQVGCFGDISCTSTHAAHTIATGEGGLVFCDDDETYQKMRRVRDWGRAYGSAVLDGYHEGYTFGEFGLNLHATDIQAALGLVQLKRLGEFVSRRRENYNRLRGELKDLPVTLPRVEAAAFPSWFCFPLLCKDNDERNALRLHLEADGIETRTILAGNMLRQPLGIEGPECPVADEVFKRGVWFSVHPKLTVEDRTHIVHSMQEFYADR